MSYIHRIRSSRPSASRVRATAIIDPPRQTPHSTMSPASSPATTYSTARISAYTRSRAGHGISPDSMDRGNIRRREVHVLRVALGKRPNSKVVVCKADKTLLVTADCSGHLTSHDEPFPLPQSAPGKRSPACAAIMRTSRSGRVTGFSAPTRRCEIEPHKIRPNQHCKQAEQAPRQPVEQRQQHLEMVPASAMTPQRNAISPRETGFPSGQAAVGSQAGPGRTHSLLGGHGARRSAEAAGYSGGECFSCPPCLALQGPGSASGLLGSRVRACR